MGVGRARREAAAIIVFVVVLAAVGARWRWSVRCEVGVAGVPCEYLIVPAPGPLPPDRGVGTGAYVYASSPQQPNALGYCYRCLVTSDGHRYRLRGRTAEGELDERLSPDGRWLVEPGDGSDLLVRDLTGTTVYPLADMGLQAWSANGRYVLAVGYGRAADLSRRYVRLDLRTGDRVEYVAPTAVVVLGVRETGALLLADQSVKPAPAHALFRSIDAERGQEIRRHDIDLSAGSAPVEPLHAVAVTDDGHRAVAVSRCFLCTGSVDFVVLLLDLDSGRLLHRTDLPREFGQVRLVPEGALIQQDGGPLLLLDPATGRRRVAARVLAGTYVEPRGVNVN